MIGIYKITSPTNKIYIGQSIDIDRRKNEYKRLQRCKRQTRLYNSLKKYGYENHKFEIIEECSEDKLLERETYWKNYYKVLEIPSLCCRMDGRGGRLSEETKQKIINSNKGKVGNYIRNDKIKNKISISNSISIYQFSLNGEFIKKWDSITKAEYVFGKGIKENLKQKTKSSHGYVWNYTYKFPGYNIFHKNSKSIIQYDLNKKFIKEWNSIIEIEKTLGYPNSNISSCCNNKQKTAYGFIWEFKT
jgi:group I intron endonuclease